MRYSDCEIEEFKIREAMREARDGSLVDQAMRDLIAGNFESDAVHAVMGRRAGSIADYVEAKRLYEAAALAARHSGAA